MVEIVFHSDDGTVTRIDAEPGKTLMANAKAEDVEGIVAECGGSMVCGTCHVYIAEPWYSRMAKPSEMEAEMLEFGLYPKPESRLSCQIEVTDEMDGLEVGIPASQL